MTNGPTNFDSRWPWAIIVATAILTPLGVFAIVLIEQTPVALQGAMVFAGVGASTIASMFSWIRMHEQGVQTSRGVAEVHGIVNHQREVMIEKIDALEQTVRDLKDTTRPRD